MFLKNMPLKKKSMLEQMNQILRIVSETILLCCTQSYGINFQKVDLIKTEAYKKQRNLCVSLLHQNKKDYFEALDVKFVTGNKMFWKTVAPLFSNRSKASNKITLTENEKLIMNDQKCAEVFNNYFNSIVKELNIPINQNLLNDASIFDDPVIAAAHMYERHPSILKIKEKVKKHDLFPFYHVNPDKMLNILQNIDSKKATQQGDIPVRIMKESKFTFFKNFI